MKSDIIRIFTIIICFQFSAYGADCTSEKIAVEKQFLRFKQAFKANSHDLSSSLSRLQTGLNEDHICRKDKIIYLAQIAAMDILGGNISITAKLRMNDLMGYLVREDKIDLINNKKLSAIKKLKILGAYSCKEDKIWISPDNSPYNLGTVLLHEISHWARSLSVDHIPEKSLEDFSNRESYYLFDEAMSSLEGGYRQLSHRSDLNRLSDHLLPTTDNPVYMSSEDLNLYNRAGSLSRAWGYNVEFADLRIGTSFGDFFQKHLLSNSSPEVLEIFKLTENVYLDSSSPLSTDAFNLAKKASNGIKILNSPIEWILSLNLDQVRYLDKHKTCRLNGGPNPGGEGVGLHLQGMRTCLEPIRGM